MKNCPNCNDIMKDYCDEDGCHYYLCRDCKHRDVRFGDVLKQCK